MFFSQALLLACKEEINQRDLVLISLVLIRMLTGMCAQRDFLYETEIVFLYCNWSSFVLKYGRVRGTSRNVYLARQFTKPSATLSPRWAVHLARQPNNSPLGLLSRPSNLLKLTISPRTLIHIKHTPSPLHSTPPTFFSCTSLGIKVIKCRGYDNPSAPSNQSYFHIHFSNVYIWTRSTYTPAQICRHSKPVGLRAEETKTSPFTVGQML